MGGSDEGMEMLIGGVLKALFHDIGFNISNEILSKGCPSRRTIARIEYRLCADCYFHAVSQMKKDGVKYISITMAREMVSSISSSSLNGVALIRTATG